MFADSLPALAVLIVTVVVIRAIFRRIDCERDWADSRHDHLERRIDMLERRLFTVEGEVVDMTGTVDFDEMPTLCLEHEFENQACIRCGIEHADALLGRES